MTIQIKCDNCGNELEADEKYIGQNAECPNCHHRIIILSSIDNGISQQSEPIASQQAQPVALQQVEPKASDEIESIASEQGKLKVTEQTEQTEQLIKYCPKCGESVRAHARFCMKCGTPISNAQADPTMTAPTVIEETNSHKEQENVSLSTITIERTEQILGPFDYGQFKEMFKKNQLYLNDITLINNTGDVLTLKKAVKKLGWEFPESEKANKVIHKIGIDFLFPYRNMKKVDEYNNSHFIYMCIVGLIPLILINLGIEMDLPFRYIYTGYAAYFTLLWSMFFWAILNTEYVEIKQCLKCFFCTFFISMTLLLFLHFIGIFRFADYAIDSELTIIKIIGYLFAAGVPEEICKAFCIYWLLSKRGKYFHAEAIVFYGIFSGLAFGIKEGLLYQQGRNKLYSVDETYFYNLLRLTSLPFLHALWCGIASYFLAFAAHYPMYRYWLTIIAILLPAILHAVYDGSGNFLGIIISVITVFLFLFYYRNIKTLDQKLNNI